MTVGIVKLTGSAAEIDPKQLADRLRSTPRASRTWWAASIQTAKLRRSAASRREDVTPSRITSGPGATVSSYPEGCRADRASNPVAGR